MPAPAPRSWQPYVLPSVRAAEAAILAKKVNHEYAPITGVPEFVPLSMKFVYGENSPALKEKRVAGTQALSGTGALRLGGEMLARFVGKGAPVYVPTPTWGNHIPIFKDAGLVVKHYRYYDPKTIGLDFGGLMADVAAAPAKSIFMFHVCAHNPTGVDPTPEQWKEISAECKKRGHVVFMDCAYQGFASGDADKDAFAVRQFVADGHRLALAQSYAKNFGLYGQRVGAFSMVGADQAEAERLLSQIKIMIRPMYSNPPVHGARIVSTILGDAKLAAQWYGECKGMAERIQKMRTLLTSHLAKAGSSRDWSHINRQIGMFAFSGLNPKQVEAMTNEHHIYMTKDGRISMAGVTSGNVAYLANAMHSVSK